MRAKRGYTPLPNVLIVTDEVRKANEALQLAQWWADTAIMQFHKGKVAAAGDAARHAFHFTKKAEEQ